MSSVLGLVGVAQMGPWYLNSRSGLNADVLSHLADYSASKAALVNLNESLRYELDKLCASSGCAATSLLTR